MDPDQTVDEATTPVVLDVTDPTTRTVALERAAEAVGEGECIVLPTDTVYGIGADALDPLAVQRLLNTKERGRDMPPPVLVGDAAVLPALCDAVPQAAHDLAEEFWPGGLTLVLRAQESLTMDLGETHGTIAVRVPDQDATRELLRLTGPLAVSSANKSGRPPALTVAEATEQLGVEVAVYLDGGQSRIGEPSTIIDFASTSDGKVLRQGALSLDEIHRIAPAVVGLPEPDPEPEPEPADPQPADPEPVENGTDPTS